jgi:hypothetical protein
MTEKKTLHGAMERLKNHCKLYIGRRYRLFNSKKSGSKNYEGQKLKW